LPGDWLSHAEDERAGGGEIRRRKSPISGSIVSSVPLANSVTPGTIHIMYDPVQKAEETAKIVCRGEWRKYRRFRPARFYGGIATADCVGCCLRCIFCWSWHELARCQAIGEFYTPEQVAMRLTKIARKNDFDRVRISGHEPTLCREHLVGVLEHLPSNLLFILETNGILIGHDATYAAVLARFENLYVRVSLKGTSEKEFSRLTGAVPEGFLLQLTAVGNLHRAGVRVQPAVMTSFSSPENVAALSKRLAEISPELADIEAEELVLYGNVAERLKLAGIHYRSACRPDKIPPEQV
jgi:uncharacterized Fe-S cluster-containing radical SAM superfamily protein